MNGLDKIIKDIELDASDTAQKLIDEAERTAARLIEKAEGEARLTESRAAEDAEAGYKRIIARADSAGSIETNRIILREKQRIINDVINRAKSEIINADAEEYFGFLIRLLDRYASGKPGELILSSRDKRRITKAFTAAADEKMLALSGADGDFEGGFVLVYGEVEENCTIEALMSAESDRLHDAIGSILF